MIAALAWLAALGTLRYRIPYGVSHRDEAFYSAMPYSFLIGNQPYFDERAIHQNAGILLMPFYRMYLAVAGSADGIILFNRYLYLTYVGFCSLLVYRLIARITSFSSACWAAALLVCFGYFNLFALSYNSQGALGFLCGVLLSAHALLGPRPGRGLFVANLFFLSAVFSYPGLIIALLPYNLSVLGWLYWKTPRSTWISGLFGLGAGLSLALAVFAAFAWWLGTERYERLRDFQQGLGYGAMSGLAKLDFYHSSAWGWRWALLAYATVFVLLPLACFWFQRGLWLVAAAGAVGCIASYRFSAPIPVPTQAMLFFVAIPMLAPVCVALNRGWSRGRFLLLLVWAPSLVSMLAVTYTSSNGLLAALLGALGALVAGIAAFGALLEARAKQNPSSRLGYRLVLIGFAGACLGLEAHSMFAFVYDESDAQFSSHDTRVRTGPLRGTIATRAEAEIVEAVDRDLKSLAGSARSLTIFDGFATGYMSTRLRPRTWCQWIYWGLPNDLRKRLMAETFGEPAQLPDLVLKIRMEKPAKQLWAKYERGRYHTVIERKELGYVILQRNELTPK
ncbi:MAG TPA: hypothetical protein VJV79_39860 [Polyangiaceae bacterium]|nr:hypothetical protein [Polyangiaceae bacterium]